MRIKTPNGVLEGDTITEIIKKHGKDCLRDADLRGANLYGANLYGAGLRGADLCNANLNRAALSGADLRDASLYGANLYGAGLRGADLCNANLNRAALSGADLRDADLRGANLRNADLRGASLYGADLRGASLRGAGLRDADFDGARNIPLNVIAQTSILPDEGDVIGWKQAKDFIIVKLLIPSDAQRSNATGRKCRASKAKVLDIQNIKGESLDGITAHSKYDKDFIYRKGETVQVDNFDTNRWNECAPGIHFFITRWEAAHY